MVSFEIIRDLGGGEGESSQMWEMFEMNLGWLDNP